MDREDAKKKLLGLMTEGMVLDPEKLKDESASLPDCGMDDLDEAELVIVIEDEFDTDGVPEEVANGWETLGQVIDWVAENARS